MGKARLVKLIPVFITLPSVFIGIVAMYCNEVSTFIWAQNIGYFVIVALISYFAVSGKFRMRGSMFYYGSLVLSLILILLTFIMPGLDGIHRWVSLGIIQLNASMVLMPIIIIASWRVLQDKSIWVTIATTVAITIFLAIQPDASQVTGFAVPMMIMLVCKTDKKAIRLLVIGILSVLIILSWVLLDSLPPVSYVEGILGLVNNVGLVWSILGILSLIILPIPFILFPPKNFKIPSICLGLYFIIITASTLFGNFPVPLMGFGVSPMIGYFISISWYTRAIITEKCSN